jgi:hypothetical protein
MTMQTREQVAADYKLNDAGVIVSPGKFEGEDWSTPAIYAMAMDGESSFNWEWTEGVESEDVFMIESGDEMHAHFGLADDVYAIGLFYSPNGFVTQTRYTKETFAARDADYESTVAGDNWDNHAPHKES